MPPPGTRSTSEAQGGCETQGEGDVTEVSQARRAQSAHATALLALPNIVGVGVGFRERGGRLTNEICVVALARRKIASAGMAPDLRVPAAVDGVPTDVREVGDLKAHAARTERWRPAPGGVSIGHFQITAGTLGCTVRDRATGTRLILSNNHVLANGNDAAPEDPILQPGVADGGREETDPIASLERFVPIAYSQEPATCGIARTLVQLGNAVASAIGSKHRLAAYRQDTQAVNQVDAAVARPWMGADLADEVLEIGRLTGSGTPALGQAVRKSGRTTGLTTGVITVVEATVDVDYGGKTARFERQVLSGPMSKPGDSGSVLVAADAPVAVGLLFAGSDQVTIYNPMRTVLDALEVDIG